jgi:hypothetical protein
MRQVRLLMRAGALLVAALTLALAAWFGINATDEALSSEAKAAMSFPPAPPPSEKNGFMDFLALGAAEGAPSYEVALRRLQALNNQKPGGRLELPSSDFPGIRIDEHTPQCRPADSSCLDAAAGYPRLQDLIDSHRVFLARYRAMREKPEFINLFVSSSPEDSLPAYQGIFQGSRLSMLAAAVRFNAGDRAAAIQELEKENAFHRRMAAQSRTLLDKMLSFAALDRDALFIAELAREISPNEIALWPRLEALVRAPTKDELDAAPWLKQEIASIVRWMQTRRYVRLPDSVYEFEKSLPESIGTRPWWDWFAPYLYRPHQSVNLFAARAQIMLAVAERPSTEFFKASDVARERMRALEPGILWGAILNPVGRNHYHLNGDFSDYIGRMHAFAGVQRLVHLQVMLRATGISKPEEVLAALAGPLGRSHLDPFTGKPMRFDARTRTVGFDTQPKYISGPARALVERYGRMALPL